MPTLRKLLCKETTSQLGQSRDLMSLALIPSTINGISLVPGHIGCNREWQRDNLTDYFTDGTWVNTLGMENDDKSQIPMFLSNIMTAI